MQTVIFLTCLFSMTCTTKDIEIGNKFEIYNTTRQRLSMDFDWRFNLGHTYDITRDFMFGDTRTHERPFAKAGSIGSGGMGSISPVHTGFNDNDWRKIDLPHDWAVELDFDPAATTSHGYKKLGREWPSNSIGWYRKTFEVPESDEGNRLSIEFDGVFRDCMVWLNGFYLGRHMSGYTSFRYDISDCVNYGGRNVLVVRVDASFVEGWFYEGAGIYRHVWLVKTNPLHVAQWGTFVSSTVDEDAASAEVTIKTKVTNEDSKDASCQLVSSILNFDGETIIEDQSNNISISAWDSREVVQRITLMNPKLWSLDSPHLYRLVMTVKQDGIPVDTYVTPFGIRTVRFDANKGFFLNDKPLKIKGVCIHQDHAGVGSALPDRIQEFRIEKLKEMGCNAVRCAHNPPTPELLDACDRLGMLVIDEQRVAGSSTEIITQLESIILRDRNHPSVFLWSMGNEEAAIEGTDIGARILTTMKRKIKQLDPIRQVTIADANTNNSWGSKYSQVSDVLGCNYFFHGDIDAFHVNFPEQPIIGTENANMQTTRGIYKRNDEQGFTSEYGTSNTGLGASTPEAWRYCVDRQFIAGIFLWTGIDYRGEPGKWPSVSSHFGIMDVCCFPKDIYYYYKAWWSDSTVLHILPHWNWAGKEGQTIDVWCYSNCDEVELFLNEKSLGRKEMPLNSHLQWEVSYEPGKLEAKGYINGEIIARKVRETIGASTQLRLSPDRLEIRADNEDVAIVTVAVLDGQGRLAPTAQDEVNFEVSNNAKIIGVGNGNPSSHEQDKANKRKVFNGLCQVIIQSTREAGEIQLMAKSPGLLQTSIIIRAKACEQKPFIPSVEH